MVSKNIVFYGILAIAVALIVFISVLMLKPSSSYNVAVHIAALNHSTSNAIYPYQTSHFLITVYNKDNFYAKAIPLGFYLNGTELAFYKVSIPANSNVSINENYTYDANGIYPFSAVLDPANVLNIVNRTDASSVVNINVKSPQTPDLYAFIPDNGILNTTEFSLFPKGAAFSSLGYESYNTSKFKTLFGPSQDIISKIFTDVLPLINVENGAYVRYHNGSIAYGAWIQGTLTSDKIALLLSTFNIPEYNFTANGNTATYAKASNDTSICTLTNGGWTKVMAYYNNSNGSTCINIISKVYSPFEANVIINASKSNPIFEAHLRNFTYTNSTPAGYVFGVASNSMYSMNMFQNSFGTFAAYLKKNAHPRNLSNINNSTFSCLGLIYSNNKTGTSVCSTYLFPINGASQSLANYSFIKSEEIGTNYTAILYSFVNSSNALDAHYNAAKLIQALNLSQRSAIWQPAFKNSCSISNSSIGCKALAFNTSDDFASMQILNRLPHAIHINTISCFISGEEANQTINQTIASGSSANDTVACNNIPVPIATITTAYDLQINYTYENAARLVNGTFNATNAFFG